MAIVIDAAQDGLHHLGDAVSGRRNSFEAVATAVTLPQ
jgi:hypothetical protein